MLDLIKKARFLDPKLFTAFAAAAEVQNFTYAAKVAHMTQSGISQHIARLEEQIERPLFKRIGKQVVLTETGQALLSYIREHVAELDTFFERVHEVSESLSGLVSYAMPPSCLLSGHFPELLRKRAEHPELKLRVTLASSPEVLDLVAQDRADFGFVTSRPLHSALNFTCFCDEEYILVSADAELMKKMRPRDLFEERVVGYPGADVYYNMWLRHHVSDNRDYHSLLRSGEINSIEGAIAMVIGGLGSAVMPRHCVQGQLDRGALFEYRAGNVEPLNNTIYISVLRDVEQSRRVRQVLSWFFEMVRPSEPAVSPERRERKHASGSHPSSRTSGIRKRADLIVRRPA